MILVILGIAIALVVTGAILWVEIDDELGSFVTFFGGLITIAAIVTTIILGVSVSNLRVIDDKIAMYEAENTKIEEQIDAAVKQYQDYESGVFAETSSESSITLVSLYPELKSDELVKKQIEVYMNNNEQIKELKTKEINGRVYRWWLYFGG